MRANLNKIQWCPWCGDFFIHAAIKSALKELNIPKHKVVVVSGIGCSGKTSQYLDGYASETLHGRAVPFATGVKLANPDLTVIVYGGDGDGYWIWLGHFLHACRRNINLTYIVANNENYGLTTGQASPTTPLHAKTKSTPQGNTITPFNPNALAQAAGCGHSVHVLDKDLPVLIKTIIEGITHPWFSHIDVDQACPTWRKR